MNDILNNRASELKVRPYSVPEGYFDVLEGNLKHPASRKSGFMEKVTPYMALAASFIIIVTAGTFLLKNSFEEESMTFEDYMVHSSSLTINQYIKGEEISEENELQDEDIVNYLIYTGVTAELIEISK